MKFESKSNRVKGLAFHPRRPWILASLHNGVIQLWDYRMEVMVDRFEEHDGPVRGIHFHRSQPLFVSGGDDYKIKVWNYQQRRCLYNLLGHLDYIRTVQFHNEYPWIVSASDDQTIRIWNWQSRQCISVLTGHNHYVMCASFHPKEDLVLSASLDQTVRVWDISGLRKKTVSIAGDLPIPGGMTSSSNGSGMGGVGLGGAGGGGPGGVGGPGGPSADLFGSSDVVVKHVLEGHTRGVNWAAFHRSLSLIVSGADDREVKLWRMNDSKAWEVDTMRGHVNNVSCVLFHPRKELIISNSEDKTIRVWDISKQMPPQTIRRDNDRYWILDAHPNLNLLAAGHDSGLVVFKLNRERPPHDGTDSRNLYYFKDMYIYEYNYKSAKERPILSTRRRGSGGLTSYRHLHYNSSNREQHCLLLMSDLDSSYELYVFAKQPDPSASSSSSSQRNGSAASSAAVVMEDQSGGMKGFARSAVFVSRNRFAILDKSRQLYLKTLKNETKRKISIAGVVINHIFYGGIGRLLIRTPEAMLLYDIQSLKVLAELPIQTRHPIKHAVWSTNHQFLALFSKATIYITDSRLVELCTLTETSRIKSGAWDSGVGVFLYTTGTHLKYLLPNGESGIIRTLENTVYVTTSSSTQITFLDRDVKTGKLAIDATEYLFKVALHKKKNREVLRIMQTKKLSGQSIIAYLHKKGYPEVALHFVDDLNIKFSLALECGNIAVALECATKLDNDSFWHKLGVEALRQGNHQVVEAAYQKTKNFERLSFLYLITGNVDKLSKMLHIAKLRNDMMGRFHNALYLGDVQERIAVLKETGQTQLAYLAAMTHGLEEEALALQQELADRVPTLPDLSNGKLLYPPIPILKENNWPLLEVRRGFFESLDLPDPEDVPIQGDEGRSEFVDSDDDGSGAAASKDRDNEFGDEAADDQDLTWGDDNKKSKKADTKPAAAAAATSSSAVAAAAAASGGSSAWGDDLDIPDVGSSGDESTSSSSSAAADAQGGGDDYFVMPTSGQSYMQRWGTSNSVLAADLIAAGNVDLAMHMLHRQIGVVNFAPLASYFATIQTATHALLPQLAGVPPISTGLSRVVVEGKSSSPSLADNPFKLTHLIEPLKRGYQAVTDNNLTDALSVFQQLLHTLPFIIVEKKAQVAEVVDLIGICREYITACRIGIRRRDSADPVEQTALAAYFTNTSLQPSHLVLALKVAIKATYQLKNFVMTATFCRRFLELLMSNPALQQKNPDDPKRIKSILQASERENRDEKPFDLPDTAFTLCCKSFTPIPRGRNLVKCPYCGSAYLDQFDATLCATCSISKIGQDCTGIKVFPE